MFYLRTCAPPHVCARTHTFLKLFKITKIENSGFGSTRKTRVGTGVGFGATRHNQMIRVEGYAEK